jgi:hypothetical protein
LQEHLTIGQVAVVVEYLQTTLRVSAVLVAMVAAAVVVLVAQILDHLRVAQVVLV